MAPVFASARHPGPLPAWPAAPPASPCRPLYRPSPAPDHHPICRSTPPVRRRYPLPINGFAMAAVEDGFSVCCSVPRLEMLCQAAISIEPSEGSFDDPSPWQQLKASRVSGAFDDFDSPVTEPGKGLMQTGAVVGAVGKEAAQPGKQLADGLNDQHRPMAFLYSGGVTRGTDKQTAVFVQIVAFRARYAIAPALDTGGFVSVFVDLTSHSEVHGALARDIRHPDAYRADVRRNSV